MLVILGVGFSGGLLVAAASGTPATGAAAPREVPVLPAQEDDTGEPVDTGEPGDGNGETGENPQPPGPEPIVDGTTATSGDGGGGISVAQATVIAAGITAVAAVLAAIIAAAGRSS